MLFVILGGVNLNKLEFLNILKNSLTGYVDNSVINENLSYYSMYFDEEISKGRSEEEVAESLGNPQFIAKTIIDASGINEDRKVVIEEEDAYYENKGKVFEFKGIVGIIVFILLFILVVFVLINFVMPLLVIFGIIYAVKKIFELLFSR